MLSMAFLSYLPSMTSAPYAILLFMQMHSMAFLSYLLSMISAPYEFTVEQASSVEACCLEALQWRLGPYFLIGDEEEGDDADR